MTELPTGVRGQALAIGLLFVLLGLVWFGGVAPLHDWYTHRADLLDQRRALASRMENVAAALPQLRRDAEGAAASPGSQALLEGSSDAVAGAALQGQVESLATRAGTAVSSLELLPAEPSGAYRRMGLRVSVSGPWSAMIPMLAALAEASPRMLVDDLQLQPAPSLTAGAAQPIAATFTVFAFRQAL